MAPLTGGAANFDPLVRAYRWLELLAFGRDLERARFCLLDRLSGCRSILMLGEGDGRSIEQVVQLAPAARIHCVDASSAMIARARARLPEDARRRVDFEQADVLRTQFAGGHYDAVVTPFFLDCFTTEQVSNIIDRVQPALLPDAGWLFVDFTVPPSGWRRWRAVAWLRVLYAFFRWQTGLPARSLPPSEALLVARGFRCTEARSFNRAFVRSALYRAPSPAA
jgi:ubiquinone/menaquinone biosynthesis C-methylase UbiE